MATERLENIVLFYNPKWTKKQRTLIRQTMSPSSTLRKKAWESVLMPLDFLFYSLSSGKVEPWSNSSVHLAMLDEEVWEKNANKSLGFMLARTSETLAKRRSKSSNDELRTIFESWWARETEPFSMVSYLSSATQKMGKESRGHIDVFRALISSAPENGFSCPEDREHVLRCLSAGKEEAGLKILEGDHGAVGQDTKNMLRAMLTLCYPGKRHRRYYLEFASMYSQMRKMSDRSNVAEAGLSSAKIRQFFPECPFLDLFFKK